MSITRARLIQQEAMTAAQRPYALALAAQVEDLDATQHWDDFRRILERSYVLVGLEAAADAYAVARRSGLAPKRQQFAKVGQLEFNIEAGPFLKAIAEFESRIPLLADEVKQLVAEARDVGFNIVNAEMEGGLQAALSKNALADQVLRGSFWVSSTTQEQLVDLRSVLAGMLRGDLPAGELRQMGISEFITAAQGKGIRNLSAFRLETIYRNNLSSVYSETAARTLERADVTEVMPLVMLAEIKDRRTRGNPSGINPKGFHWQMDGFLGRMPDFRRLGIIPPNGHNCRGRIRGISIGEAISSGWMNDDGDIDATAVNLHNGERLAIIERGDYPDPGFKGA